MDVDIENLVYLEQSYETVVSKPFFVTDIVFLGSTTKDTKRDLPMVEFMA